MYSGDTNDANDGNDNLTTPFISQDSTLPASPDVHNAAGSSVSVSFPSHHSTSRYRRNSQPRLRGSLATSDIEEGRDSSRIDGFRILDRNGAFRQSRGRWGVHRQSRRPFSSSEGVCRWMCRSRSCICGRLACFQEHVWHEWNLGGWFHRLAYQRTGVLMLILFATYAGIVLLFAFIYLAASTLGQTTETNPDGSETVIPFCHMDVNNKVEALYVSLSTMAAIGYGVSNYFLGDCYTPLVLVLCQVGSAILFDAVAVGLLFHRVSRGRKRGRTIAFSDKAVIHRVGGIPYLMFRIGELRRYHLIGSKIRCHCIRHERLAADLPPRNSESEKEPAISVETTYFVSRSIGIMNSNGAAPSAGGSDILMGLPQVIVHPLDESSPLWPPRRWYDGNNNLISRSTGLVSEANQNRKRSMETATPVRHPELLSHPGASPEHTSNQPGANANSYPEHSNIVEEENWELENLQRFWTDRDIEMVVLVEGTDEGTGAATQARHSYKFSDLAWNHQFAPCIFPYNREGQRSIGSAVEETRVVEVSSNLSRRSQPICSVDFNEFHRIIPSSTNNTFSPYVS